MKKLLSKIGLEPFVIGILLMVIVSYYFPQLADIQKPVSLNQITDVGVGLIFFFYGLKLDLSALRKDLSNWKLHLLTQLVVFLLFPLLILCFYPLAAGTQFELLWLAFFFLACLPSTVSSSVVMVSIAGGNVPSAIFNASISSLLGVLFTPLWMSIFLTGLDADVDFSSIFYKLSLQVLLPITLGILGNRYWGAWARKNKSSLKHLDQSIILLIVYASFSHSFTANLFDGLSFLTLISLIFCVILLFFTVYFFTQWLGKKCRFNTADRITLTFCSSKKSLVHGTVMSSVLFTNPADAAIMLLPIMLYHAIQLIITSFIANKIDAKNTIEILGQSS